MQGLKGSCRKVATPPSYRSRNKLSKTRMEWSSHSGHAKYIVDTLGRNREGQVSIE